MVGFRTNLLKAFSSFLRIHPGITLTLLYIYVSAVGLLFEWFLFREFGLNVFHFADTNDFLIAAFSQPLVVLLISLLIATIIVQLLDFLFVRSLGSHPQHPDNPTGSHSKFLSHVPRIPLRKLLPIFTIIFLVFNAFFISQALSSNLAHRVQLGLTTPISIQYGEITYDAVHLIATTHNYILFYDPKQNLTIVTPAANTSFVLESAHEN